MYNRVRSDGSLVNYLGTNTFNKQGPCTPLSDVSHPQCFPVGTIRTTSDVVTANFHRKVKEGVVINNPFASIKETCTYTPGMITANTKYPPPWNACSTYSYTLVGLQGIGDRTREVPINVDQLITDACTDALSKIDDPTAQGMVFLAQIQLLIQTLQAPLSGAVQFLTSMLSGKTQKSLKGAANQHLIIIYGLLPAMKDIEDILKAIQATRPKRQTARSQRSYNRIINWTRPYSDVLGNTGTITGIAGRTVTVRAGSFYQHEFDLGISKFGMSISNIPSAAWELIPYSFVVDWFVNVGKYIAAISPTIGTRRLAEWYTIIDETVRTENLGPVSNAGMWTVSGGGATATSIIKTCSRIPTNLGDNAGLVFNPRLNISNIFAAISLITQKLPRLYYAKGPITD